MKRQLRILIWCALCGAAFAPSWGQNLLLEDYRPPVSSARALRLNLDLDYAGGGGEPSSNRSNLFAQYRYFYDSLPFAYFVDASVDAARSSGSDERVAIEASERVRAFVYKDLFGGAELRRSYRSSGPDAGGESSGSLGVGYGRFINATPLAKAARMEDTLLELGLLRDDLPAETMIELGQIIQRESEFKEQYGDTFRQEWFKAMERAALESGMMIEPELGAAALLKMDETLLRERIFDRYFGWEISLSVGSDLFPFEKFKEGGRVLEGAYRLAKPLGWRLQWNETLTLQSPMDEHFGDSLRFAIESEISYEVSNRIDLIFMHRLNASREPDETGAFENAVDSRLQASFTFFIENALTLNSSAFWSSEGGSRNQGLSLIFGYRLF